VGLRNTHIEPSWSGRRKGSHFTSVIKKLTFVLQIMTRADFKTGSLDHRSACLIFRKQCRYFPSHSTFWLPPSRPPFLPATIPLSLLPSHPWAMTWRGKLKPKFIVSDHGVITKQQFENWSLRPRTVGNWAYSQRTRMPLIFTMRRHLCYWKYGSENFISAQEIWG